MVVTSIGCDTGILKIKPTFSPFYEFTFCSKDQTKSSKTKFQTKVAIILKSFEGLPKPNS